ncbi:MAG TPA: LPS export ABC transporter permease LptF [Rhizomicrobium sp.]|nr:LPS export ABC transporter permease LptF [Rhizomicrobium sp.]
MPRLSLYVLRQLIGPVVLFAAILTAVIWLSQSLRLLDLVINRGQSAPVFVYLTILMIPGMLVIILPLAYFGGTLFGLHKLNADSELVVMSASGYSRWQLALPVLAAAGGVVLVTYFCTLYLMPQTQRMMKDKVLDIRADIGAAILSEGAFNTPADGLTVFIRELSPDGHIAGILVHDNRDAHRPITYIAESGLLVQTPAGARLIMQDGTIEQSGEAGAQLSVLRFQRYVFDLDQFAGQQRKTERETSERFLGELIWPKFATDPGQRVRDIFMAEAHNRLSAPLYPLAFAMIALAVVTRGRRARGAYALRLTGASLAAGALRILGYGAQGVVARDPSFAIILYLIPLLGAAFALAEVMEVSPSALVERFYRRPEPAPEPAS